MAAEETRPWTRIQDWLSLVAGAVLALSPIWLEVTTTVMWTMVIIGAAVAVMALIALAMPGAYIDEWMMALAGVAAFVAPWVFSYTDVQAAAWTSWVVGVVVAGSALLAVPSSRAVYRHQHHAA
jgi:hypothetical protein